MEAARAALALAERLGDVVLRSDALGALEQVLLEQGKVLEALEAGAERNELLPRVADPDRVADAQFVDAQMYASIGRFDDARAMAGRMEETVAGLTPHHRVHALGCRIILESAAAEWEAVRQLTPRVEEAIEANLATPCPFNRGLLIVLATGWTYAGNVGEADRLLARAEAVGMGSYLAIHVPRWLALAIARNDRADIQRLIDSIRPAWLTPGRWDTWAVLFDGLMEIDDRERIEVEAPQWLNQELYVTPFATRALAVARRDEALLEDAAARFEAMGLERHAQATRAVRTRLTEREPSN